MRATIRAYWLPKAGNAASDYEDAFWPRKPRERDSSPIRLAVGDGATETSFSALWARLLVRDYGRGLLAPEGPSQRLPALRDRWRRLVGGKPLPWYAEAKLRDGAFSSLVGLTIEDDPDGDGSRGRWKAMAIGDSCLFHVRGERLIAGFPLQRAEQFDSRPTLVSSVPSGNSGIGGAPILTDGECRVGDVFHLMTDALACWFLERLELRDGDPFHYLNRIEKAPDFEEFIRSQREDRLEDGRRLLKNDDVTLVTCRVDP